MQQIGATILCKVYKPCTPGIQPPPLPEDQERHYIIYILLIIYISYYLIHIFILIIYLLFFTYKYTGKSRESIVKFSKFLFLILRVGVESR